MKCWNSVWNTQGLRLIIVIVHLGAAKIHVAAVEALRKKERQDETQFPTKIDGFLSFIPRWMLMYFFAGFFLISTCVWPNSGFWCCVFLPLQIILLSDYVYCSSFRFGNQRERPLEELDMAWIIQLDYVLDEKIRRWFCCSWLWLSLTIENFFGVLCFELYAGCCVHRHIWILSRFVFQPSHDNYLSTFSSQPKTQFCRIP
jgi:hypothetical protein